MGLICENEAQEQAKGGTHGRAAVERIVVQESLVTNADTSLYTPLLPNLQ